MDTEKLGKCANPECNTEFKRLGTGRVYSIYVTEPVRWGLPPNIRQKVVWLCSSCAKTKQVHFDREQCRVLVVNKHTKYHQKSA